MKKLKNQTFTGERALFFGKDLEIENCTFEDGESPLKESANIALKNCSFKWKYLVWYSKNVTLKNCTLFEMARSGVWYTEGISFTDCNIIAPKTFRRAKNITLENVTMPNASETLWSCENVVIKNVAAKGDYFGMNGRNFVVSNFTLDGNYFFDGGEDIVVDGSVLLSKDSFWNCKNVYVKNSRIVGEYIGWNSRNVTFENCEIESLQGFCYMKNVTLINCRLIDTTLAFEYSDVNATIDKCDSIKNPSSGKIVVGEVGELIMEKERVDVTKTEIKVTGKKQ